jgi:uncharacterized protein (UPF0332 family)
MEHTDMIRFKELLFLLLILGSYSFLPAQTADRIADLERQLNRLESKIREARQLGQFLNDPAVDQVIRMADNEYELARQAFQNREYLKTVNHIKLSYFYLTQLYQNLKLKSELHRRFSEQLDLKIREAEEIVGRSGNADAEKLLNRARYFRQRAVLLLENDRPEAVYRSYFVALFFAENAIKLASGSDFKNSEDFRRYLDDSIALLHQVEELAGSAQDLTANRILNRARRELREVQRFYEQNLFRQAFLRLQIVNRFLYRALDILESTPVAVNERLEFDLNMLDDRISDVREEVLQSNDAEIQKLYQRLVFITADAREKYQNSNLNGSRQQLNVANRLLYQLHRRLNLVSESQDNQLKKQLQTAEIMLDALQQNQTESVLYSRLLELLQKNYTDAQNNFREGKFPAAWQHLRFFNQLALKLNQLQSARKNDTETEQVARDGLVRLRALLDREVDTDAPASAGVIKYENARRLYDLASQACDEGNYMQCEQITRLAINALTQ